MLIGGRSEQACIEGACVEETKTKMTTKREVQDKAILKQLIGGHGDKKGNEDI